MSCTAVLFSPLSKSAGDVVISAASLVATVKIWRRLKKAIFDPYRPERHYMRGAGPKWREKHAATPEQCDGLIAVPAAERCKGISGDRPMSSSNSPMRQPRVVTN